jgi:hypothetical protein
MTKTFDTSRVGGGTYELAQDANGNYNLNSVGFTQVNKLNLPDLKTSDTTSVADTTKKATEDTIKAQTTEVFKPANVYQSGGGGGENYSTMPTVKDATVRNAGSSMPQGSPGQLSKDKARAEANVELGLEPQAYKSPTMTTKENEFAQGKYTGVQTGLQKVQSAVQNTVGNVVDSVKNNKAVQMAGTVLGAISNPVFAGARMVAGMLPKETNIQKMNKGYFNTNEGSQRISGNPATDLYAGMNRNSAFGNLETAGANRIAKREKTAATKNVSDKFKADTEKMKEQQKDYKAQKTATQKATQGPAGSGGSSGSDSGRVICTDLHKTGELSTIDWIRDTKFTFKKLTKTHVKGYLLWAEPTVKHIQKYPRYRKIWKHIAQHRANDIAWRLNEGKFDLLGRIYAGIGEPLCWALGNFVSDKQINKYNLTHWRRA